MKHIKCPDSLSVLDLDRETVFLAGGISGCPDWQSEFVEMMKKVRNFFVFINPRRDNFDTSNPEMTEEQIAWEFFHLKHAKQAIFWFPKETLCPITLFEYGKWVMTGKPFIVGCHPEYARKEDLQHQTWWIDSSKIIEQSLYNVQRKLLGISL